jgi:hypothetical protein
MLDTVALKLKHPDFRVTDSACFSPSFNVANLLAADLSKTRARYWKFTQNPRSNASTEHRPPRLTGSMRLDDAGNRNVDLVIECSIPKLLFGQSLQELSDSDFEIAVNLLVRELQKMRVEVSPQAMRDAVVIRAHFGKNIPLPSPLTAQDAIEKLSKADRGRGKDINMREYRNNGQSLYFYASSCNTIFYDKLRDIATPQNKGVDKDKSEHEKELVLGSERQPELLRYELRFGKQQSLNAFLGDKAVLGRKVTSITFREIFNRDLCQKVLLKNWKDIMSGPASQLAFKMDRPIDEVFDAIILSSISGKKRVHSLNRALQDVSLYFLVNNCGARKMRDRIERHWTRKSWQRLLVKMEGTVRRLQELPPDTIISDIQTALDKFKQYDWRP